MRKFFAILMMLLLCHNVRAQYAFSDTTDYLSRNYKVTAPKVIVPAALITAGAVLITIPSAQLAVKDYFQDLSKGRQANFDNVLQYIPAAAYLTMGFLPSGCFDFEGYQLGRLNFAERTLTLGTAAALTALLVLVPKYTVCEMRPNGTRANSFPSGHTATAFMGAELVRLEYGPAYGAFAYIAATAVGIMRLYNNWHWIGDVLAGAGVGILSAEAAYWLLPYTSKILPTKWKSGTADRQKVELALTPSAVYCPLTASAVPALGLALKF